MTQAFVILRGFGLKARPLRGFGLKARPAPRLRSKSKAGSAASVSKVGILTCSKLPARKTLVRGPGAGRSAKETELLHSILRQALHSILRRAQDCSPIPALTTELLRCGTSSLDLERPVRKAQHFLRSATATGTVTGATLSSTPPRRAACWASPGGPDNYVDSPQLHKTHGALDTLHPRPTQCPLVRRCSRPAAQPQGLRRSSSLP